MTIVRGYKKAIEAALELCDREFSSKAKAYDGVDKEWRLGQVSIYKHPSKRLYAVGSGQSRSQAVYAMDGGQ